MADSSVFEKAKKELEDFYLGVSEELLELSFKDLAQSKQQEDSPSDEKKKSGSLDPIPSSETNPRKQEQYFEFHHVSNDSNRGSFGNHRSHRMGGGDHSHASRGPLRYPHWEGHQGSGPPYSSKRKNHSVSLGHRHVVPHAPLSPHIVMVPRQSVWTPPHYVIEKGGRAPCGGAKGKMNPQRGEGAQRWLGSLVCGRAYCRRCVRIGMGEMTEGSKCIECSAGKKIQPKVCTKSRTESVLFDRCSCSRAWTMVMQQELKPPGKGPKKSVERR